VEGFQKGFLVKLRLGLDQRPVDIAEDGVGPVSEGIHDRLFDGVISIAPCAVDVGDRMTGHAGDSCLRSLVVDIVELRIIKSAAEERHDIVAAGAPSRRPNIAIAFERNLPRLSHAEQVGWIVERAEMVRAVKR